MNNLEIIINAPTSPVAFYLFNYPVRFYGIIMASAILVGYILIYKFLDKKYSFFEAEIFSNYIIYLIFIVFLGARLFYVVGSFDYYRLNPIEIPMINHGGLSIWGGIFFGIAGLYFLSKIFKFDYLLHLSVIALFLPLSQAIGRFGNYFNQEAFGLPSFGFMKLYVTQDFRPHEYINYNYFHPTFLYESVLDLILFFILFFAYKKSNPSKTIFLYLILYSLIRLIIEAIRIDSVLNFGSIHIASIISFIALLAGLIGYFKVNNK